MSRRLLLCRGARTNRRLWRLLFAFVMVLVAGCDGGPSNGRLTVRNETDRPVLWVSDGTLEDALEFRQYLQSNAVLGPGEEREVSFPFPSEGTLAEPWCMTRTQFWVLTSDGDDVADFEAPIDPGSVSVEEHLVGACWNSKGDTYVIE